MYIYIYMHIRYIIHIASEVLGADEDRGHVGLYVHALARDRDGRLNGDTTATTTTTTTTTTSAAAAATTTTTITCYYHYYYYGNIAVSSASRHVIMCIYMYICIHIYTDI